MEQVLNSEADIYKQLLCHSSSTKSTLKVYWQLNQSLSSIASAVLGLSRNSIRCSGSQQTAASSHDSFLTSTHYWVAKGCTSTSPPNNMV